ncbi:MAG: hypothetical protein ACFCUU_12410 [Cyclobacteriaceae bacterium]
MGANADTAIHIMAYGDKLTWGNITGDVKYWHSSDNGKLTTMTMADGTSVAVDLTGEGGVDAMLVSTGEAEGIKTQLQSRQLTIKFLTEGKQPKLKHKKNKILVGSRVITLSDGNIMLQ